MTLSPGQGVLVGALAEPAKVLLEVSQVADVVEKGVNTFMEAVPVLVKMLDEVARIHPFISGELRPSTSGSKCDGGVHYSGGRCVQGRVYAVIREENDKTILALYNEYVVQLSSSSGVHREFI